MANTAAKEQAKRNTKTIASHWIWVLAVNAMYLLVNAGYHYDTFGFTQQLLFAGMAMVYYVLWYQMIVVPGTPKYQADGKLADPGHDLQQGGVTEYCFDVVYLMGFTQLLSLVTSWAWWLLAVVPAYAFYMLWDSFIKPWLFSGSMYEEEPESELERKKREKRERKATRPKFQRVR